MKTNASKGSVPLPKPLCRWWQRSRPTTRGIQLNDDMPPCIEIYVPWWAWPLALADRIISGPQKLTAIECSPDGKSHSLSD